MLVHWVVQPAIPAPPPPPVVVVAILNRSVHLQFYFWFHHLSISLAGKPYLWHYIGATANLPPIVMLQRNLTQTSFQRRIISLSGIVKFYTKNHRKKNPLQTKLLEAWKKIVPTKRGISASYSHLWGSHPLKGPLNESPRGKTAALEAKKTADATTFRELLVVRFVPMPCLPHSKS